MLSDAPFFAYAIVDPKYFETLDRYKPSDEFRTVVQPLLDDTWQGRIRGFWTNCKPKEVATLEHGWKIHVSAASHRAVETLAKVVPTLVASRVAFKFCSDQRMLNLSLGKNWSQSQAGKFIVAYPRSVETFVELLQSLAERTTDMEGPYILTDRPYKDSNVVFYRYGEHEGRIRCTERGVQRRGFVLADGSWWSDDRQPYFSLPPGIDDPCSATAGAGPDQTSPTNVALKSNRYLVKKPFKFNGVGGVYLADDTETGKEVVIREARPFLAPQGSEDGFGLIKKEARVLRRVEQTGYFPGFIELFTEWKHLFMVQEKIEGQSLWGYAINFYYTGGFTPKDAFRSLVATIRRIMLALSEVHRCGVILRDLTRNNVMVTDDHQIRFIDLEFAYELDGSEPPVHAFTAGYASPEQLRNATPTPADDCYALGALILDIITFTASGHPLNRAGIIRSLRRSLRDLQLPQGLSDLVEGLTHVDKGQRWTLDQALIALDQLPEPSDQTPLFSLSHRRQAKSPEADEAIRNTLAGIETFFRDRADYQRLDRLWPASSDIFLTNPVSVQYGAAGPAMFLLRHNSEIVGDALQWITRVSDAQSQPIPPSLYAGLGGVGWLMAEAGDLPGAAKVMDRAFQDEPLALRVPGLFYGAAGWGLANLQCWGATQEVRFLDRAIRAGQALKSTAYRDGSLAYWKTDGVTYLGFGEGQSGIALFLAYLAHVTGDRDFTQLSCSAIDFDWSMRQEVGLKDRLLWYPRADSGPFHPNSPHMWFGTAGVGTAMVRCYAATDNEEYLERARWCARSIADRFTNKIWQMYGLAGFGELMLDMYQFTGDEDYLDNAYYHATALLDFAVPDGGGIGFPGDRLFRICSDFGMGTAGAGIFLHRLLNPTTLRAWLPDQFLAKRLILEPASSVTCEL